MAILVTILIFVAMYALIGGLVAWAVMGLYNFALAATFGWPELTFLKTWAILFIIGVIGSAFKSTVKSKD
jgi:hypothetical protein